jgi:hypothetical protein
MPTRKLMLSTGVLLGVILGFFGASRLTQNPVRLQPMSYTAPLVEVSPVSKELLTVEVHVDSTGRMQDYRVLPNRHGLTELPMSVKNVLIFTTFRPATFMGRPTVGTAVLSFAEDELHTKVVERTGRQ